MSDTSTSSDHIHGLDHSNLKLLSKSTPLKTSAFQQTGSILDIPSPPAPSKSSITANKATNLSHVPCKFFKQGACTAGTNCTFSHNPTPTSEASVCKYFIKGNCKFGAKCALLHTMSPYGDGRKFLVNRINTNGGASLIQQQQQQRQQQYSKDSFHDFPLSQSAGYHNSSGFSQLTAAIQQQHNQHYQQQQQQKQQQQTSQTLATSTPTSNQLAQYLQHNTSIKHHPGIMGLRTSTSLWDTPTSQSYDQSHDSAGGSNFGSLHLPDSGGFTNGTNNSNCFFSTSGHLQQIPEMPGSSNQQFNRMSRQQKHDNINTMTEPDDIYPSSSSGQNYSTSHDPKTRLSSRFFQLSNGDGDYSQHHHPSHSQSYTFQGQSSSSLQGGSFDRFGGHGETPNDIWNSTYRFSSSLSSGSHQPYRFDPDLKSVNAINIPGGHSESGKYQQQQQQQQTTTPADDVDPTCHFSRYPLLPNHQQQQQQQDATSFYASTPEPSFITPSTVGSYQHHRHPTPPDMTTAQQTRTMMQQQDENDVPFFMDDADDGHTMAQHDVANGSLGYASFTSLVRPTY
ncbi:unnamed protein product [Absidia cylindrospora]